MGTVTPPLWTVIGVLPETDTKERQTRGSLWTAGEGGLAYVSGGLPGSGGQGGRRQGKTVDKARVKGAVWDWASGMAADASKKLWRRRGFSRGIGPRKELRAQSWAS